MTNLSDVAGFSAGSSGGGGGGALPTLTTPVDSHSFTLASGRVSYNYTSGSFEGQAPSGIIKNRDVFGYWAQWYNPASTQTGFTIYSYRVDKSTGQITPLQGGAAQDVWVNSSGAGLSTTYLVYEPTHGCFFSGGNNAYPGYSTHMMGHTSGQLNSSGAVVGGTYQMTNGDHGINGTYCGCLPQGTGNQTFRSAGYLTSYAGGRSNVGTASGFGLGGWVADTNWTSTTSLWNHIYQPDVQTTPSGEVTCINGTSYSSPQYGIKIMRGSTGPASLTQTYLQGTVFCGYNGQTIYEQGDGYFGKINSSNQHVSLKDGDQDLGAHTRTSNYVKDIVGIGNNRFLFFNTNEQEGSICDLIDFDSNNNPRQIQRFAFGSTDSSVLNPPSSLSSYFVVYENNTDTYPKWLVKSDIGESSSFVTTYEITADIASYNP